jgi:hypothetical protein
MLLAGLQEKVEMAIAERLKRMGGFSEKLSESARNYRQLMKDNASKKLLDQKEEFQEKWPCIQDIIAGGVGEKEFEAIRDEFLRMLGKKIQVYGKDYLEVIKRLESDDKEKGILWMRGVVDTACRKSFEMLPSCGLIE